MCIADFYLEDSVFIAYSHDKMTPDDLILDEQGRKAFFFFFHDYSFSTFCWADSKLTEKQKGGIKKFKDIW